MFVESIWNEQSVAILRARWAAGTPGGRIADELGISAKSVFCKAQHLNLPVRNHRQNWTEERIAQLEQGWAAGDSCSQIANDLGGTTRNAVIGKVHRLGLGGRMQRRSAKPRPERKTRLQLPKRQAPPTAPRSYVPLPPEPLPEPIPCPIEPLRIPFMEIREGQCRDVIGHDGTLATFCGHPTVTGTSWCPHHFRVNTSFGRLVLA